MELCKSSFIFHINAGDSLSESFRDEDVNSSKANVVLLPTTKPPGIWPITFFFRGGNDSDMLSQTWARDSIEIS